MFLSRRRIICGSLLLAAVLMATMFLASPVRAGRAEMAKRGAGCLPCDTTGWSLCSNWRPGCSGIAVACVVWPGESKRCKWTTNSRCSGNPEYKCNELVDVICE